MRLKFHVTQTINVEPSVLIDRILLKLKLVKYEIEEVNDNCVLFNDNPWILRWRHEAIKRLDGGKFEINISQDITSVTLHYYLKLLPWLLSLVFMEFITISNRAYEGALFFAIGFPVLMIIQLITARGIAKRMLGEILTLDVS